jgi:SCAN domain-containing zinc finger protein
VCFQQDFSCSASKNCSHAVIILEEQGGSSQVPSHSPKKEVPLEEPPALRPLTELPPSQPGPALPAEPGEWRLAPSSKQQLSPEPQRTLLALQESSEELVSCEADWMGRGGVGESWEGLMGPR